MRQLNVGVEGLLICLFTLYQEVLSYGDCAYYECVNDICTCKGSSPGTSMVFFDGFIPVVTIFGVVLGCSCFLTVCTGCCKFCREREVTRHTEEPTARVSIPPPVFVTPVPSAPQENQFMEPPPYTEVVWKPSYYPPPMDQPPAYDNIAMEDDSPLAASQTPGSAPKDNS